MSAPPVAMPALVAAALVFLSSAAVLVLEILAARLLAPYVGNTLETYTAIIGVILGGIAVGSWLGGKAADARDPRSLIGPLLVGGGALAFASIPVVDNLGAGLRGAGPVTTTILTVFAFFLPAAVLSAVTPAVIKIQLASLAETGRVVGRLSALSTAGAIVGTFATGFLLVASLPTRPVVRATAVFLIAMGVVSALYLQRGRRLPVGTLLAALGASLLSFAATNPCQYESAYYCAYIEDDDARAGGRALILDTLRHSYVDLDDPAYLEFTYTRWFADVLDAKAPAGEPLDVLHVGGAGFTMPRYLRSEHPGSSSTVMEVDPLLVELAQDQLGLELGDDIEVLLGDARLSVGAVADASMDVVIGDAFGGIAVPWHLATLEFTEELHRTLRPDGVYVMNVIDYGQREFLRAEIATVAAAFDHVAVVGRGGAFGPTTASIGGNYVVVASDAPLPLEDIEVNVRRGGTDHEVLSGGALAAFVADARVLTDDFAPVDQLLQPRPGG
jgi:spermidine synthase